MEIKRQDYKFRANLPEEILKQAEFKEGDELTAEAKSGEIKLKKRK